MTDIYLKTLD